MVQFHAGACFVLHDLALPTCREHVTYDRSWYTYIISRSCVSTKISHRCTQRFRLPFDKKSRLFSDGSLTTVSRSGCPERTTHGLITSTSNVGVDILLVMVAPLLAIGVTQCMRLSSDAALPLCRDDSPSWELSKFSG